MKQQYIPYTFTAHTSPVPHGEQSI